MSECFQSIALYTLNFLKKSKELLISMEMNSFILKAVIVTICVNSILSQIQTDKLQTINNIEQNQKVMESFPYELINDNTRFNRKTGDVEYFRKWDSPQYDYQGRWVDKEKLKD